VRTVPREDTHPPLATHPVAADAVEAFLAGVAAVEPGPLVRRAVRQGLLDDWLGDPKRPNRIHVLAVGKAAPGMVWGLVEAGVPVTGIGVTPRGVQAPSLDTFEWLPGEHPTPGQGSFAAGRRVLDWVQSIPEGAPVLQLISGGSSATLERPADGWTEERFQARWRELYAAGLPIGEMNRQRAAMSALKGGRLAQRLLERTPRVRTWLVQDTPPDQPQAVGSEAFWDRDRIPLHVLASNDQLVAAAGLRLAALGWQVFRRDHRVAGDAEAEAAMFVGALRSLPGRKVALVAGGEATVRIPPGAPPGGRCCHAAVASARLLHDAGEEATVVLAAESDGIDGTCNAAGGWTRGADGGPEAGEALARFDAHGFLDARGQLLVTGPTGTNVNDLWIALRP